MGIILHTAMKRRLFPCSVGRVIPPITQPEVLLIDVIIRNQDIKKLETTCFGLTLAIIRFHLEKLFCKSVIQLCNTKTNAQNTNARLHNCITLLQNSFSRWNLMMASVRPKHVVSNFFMSWFIIITSIRKISSCVIDGIALPNISLLHNGNGKH